MPQPTTDENGHVAEIHWPSLIAATAAVSAVGIAMGLGLPLLSIILEKRGISSTLIGLNAAMAGVAAMVAAPITTKCAHDFGVARSMMIAVVIAAVARSGAKTSTVVADKILEHRGHRRIDLGLGQRSFSILHPESEGKAFLLIFQSLTAVFVEQLDVSDTSRCCVDFTVAAKPA